MIKWFRNQNSQVKKGKKLVDPFKKLPKAKKATETRDGDVNIG